MKELHRFDHQDLARFVARVLELSDVPAYEAVVTAGCLVKAHLRGFDTHGLPCLPGYIECLREGRIKARPKIVVDKPAAWTARLDADNGLGHIAAHQAMSLVLEAAEELGVGAAVVRRSNHFGAAGVYSMMALKKDCIGLVTSNASAVTAPYGAAEPILGTNPLTVAVPAQSLPPMVIDMATSEGAMKKVRRALSLGKKLPPDWALDKSGRPTTDPRLALEGVMLPFGGMKGSAITLLLDVLSGVLSGAEFGGRVLSVFTNQERESGNGHFLMAFKMDSFMPAEQFKTRMDEELNRVLALRPAEGFNEVIYPGYKEHFTETKRRKDGIPLEAALIEEMKFLARSVGIEFPS